MNLPPSARSTGILASSAALASGNDTFHTPSLPSNELAGATPADSTVKGVGSLPGTVDESAVAQLPDEHSNTLPIPAAAATLGGGAALAGGIYALKGSSDDALAAQTEATDQGETGTCLTLWT